MIPIQQLRTEVAELSREAFLERYPQPALLIRRSQLSILDDGLQRGAGRRSTGRATPILLPLDAGFAEDVKVAWIKIAAGAAEAQAFVAIGRSKKCQIRIDDETLSTVHAVIFRLGERWGVTHRGTTNGTQVNGVALDPGVQRFLNSNDNIGLGPAIMATFLVASDLYEELDQH